MGIKAGGKHNIGITHREVLAWERTAQAGDELRADKGLYLRKDASGSFWHFRFKSPETGKQRRIDLWANDAVRLAFPEASLDEARTRASNLGSTAKKSDPLEDARRKAEAEAEAVALEAERLRLEALRVEEEVRQAEVAKLRRVSVRQLFDRWRQTDLQPHLRADGKRVGRVDGGQYVHDQFQRHVFPVVGDLVVEEVRKADLLAILDEKKAVGKLRTANVLLADLRQMFDFAVERELIQANPVGSVKKSKVGGPNVKRDRRFSEDELRLLPDALARAGLQRRTELAVWLVLATGVRAGELVGALWGDKALTDPRTSRAALEPLRAIAEPLEAKVGIVDRQARTWYLPTTKNQRDHTIHLSDFALTLLDELAQMREVEVDSPVGALSPWIFPGSNNSRPMSPGSLSDQLTDRQHESGVGFKNRSKAVDALVMPDGRWTAHDLRRTCSTQMARLGFDVGVIDECLNHKKQGIVAVYVHDRQLPQQRMAFDALGQYLEGIRSGVSAATNVRQLRSLG